MKIVSIAAYFGISLSLILSLATAGYTQSACQSVDEVMPGAAATPRSLKAFQEATPEALSAFRELNLNPPMGRIVGGHAVFIENNLWQIAMVRASVPEPRRSQFCGGSIIDDTWILTAAHCVRNAVVREDPSRVDVIAGTSQFAIGGERLKVTAIHTHPMYNESTMDHDFALLRLQSPVTQGKVIELAKENTQVSEGTTTCVTGWGATFEGGPGSIDLLGAEVPIVSTDECNRPESYNGDVTASMMCAGKKEGGVDSCQGDSGGPLSTLVEGRPTLIGVVSFGEGCARRLKYGIYSRVSMVAPWIASTTTGN
jgi:transmembrane serine protease 11D